VGARGPADPSEHARVYVEGAWADVPLHLREHLRAGHALQGPAVIAEYSATTWLPPDWRAIVEPFGDLLLSAIV
jgi:N-methylhydantoinase A/oxoprolinase/acetone carboxylase beta subunit